MQEDLKRKIDNTIAEAELVVKETEEIINKEKKETLLAECKADYFIKKCVYIYKAYKKEIKENELNLTNLCYIHNFASGIDITTADEDEEKIKAFRNYVKGIDLIEQELTLEELKEAIDFYNRALLFTNEELYKTLALTFYLIKKYRGTPKATKIIELLRNYKNGLMEVIEEASFNGETDEIENLTGKYIIIKIGSTLFNFLLNNTDGTYKSLIEETNKLKEIAKEPIEETLKKAEEISKDLETTTENILNNYETINIIRINLNKIIEEPIEALLNNEEVNIILNDAKECLAQIKAIELLICLRENKDLDTYGLLYSAFSNDPIIKEEVKEPLGLQEELFKKITGEKELRKNVKAEEEQATINENKLSEELKEKAIEELKKDPSKIVYIKVGSMKELQMTHNAYSKLFSMVEPTNYKKIRELREKKEKRNYLEAKEIRTEEEIQELMDLDAEIEEKQKEIKELEEDQKDREQKIIELEEEIKTKEKLKEETKPYKEAEIKKLNEDIKKARKRLKIEKEHQLEEQKENKYIQLALNENTQTPVISATEQSVNASIEATTPLEYSIENVRLTNFIENYYFSRPQNERDNTILFTLGNYADFYGLEPSTYLKKSILEDANNKYKVNMRIIEDTEHYRANTDFRLIQGKRTIEYKDIEENKGFSREDRIEIVISDFYKGMLEQSGKNYIALLPRVINQLASKRETHLAFEVANYIYKVIVRNNVKNGLGITHIAIERKIGVFIDYLEKRGAFQKNKTNRYSRRVVDPLKEAFNNLVDLGIIELTDEEESNPFIFYDNATKKQKNEKYFKERNIILAIKIIPKEYMEIYEDFKDFNKKKKKRTTRKK